MKKKILITLGCLLLAFVVFLAYLEYQWQTKGMEVLINRDTTLGISTNQYKIRDQDLKTIESTQFSESAKKFLIKIAQDKQNAIRHSNDLDWIKSNHRGVTVRYHCYLDIQDLEYERLKIKGERNFSNRFIDSLERKTLYQEYKINVDELGATLETPSKKEEKEFCDVEK